MVEVDWARQLRDGATRCWDASWREDRRTARTLRFMSRTFSARAEAAERCACAVTRGYGTAQAASGERADAHAGGATRRVGVR